MGPIIQGAMAGIVGDKAGETLYGHGHLEDGNQQECLHADIHAIRDSLKKIAGTGDQRPFFDRVTLQPGILIPMDKMDRAYNIAFVAASTAIQFEVIGLGQAFTLTLQPGWSVLNMPEGTRWGLPSNAVGSVGVVYCATNEIFGNAI